MITTSQTETEDAAAEAAETSEETCVPLAALTLEGTAPAVGDDVEFKLGGKVARIEGGHAYITPKTINGEPIPAAPKPPDSEAAMMDEAARADAEQEKGY